ncbi:RNA recognition motif domain protein [Kalmanozyma brasiliensis GHG001]|uniref:RRM domain-containing protein n=1 Tax=Kalmanozyma brasiliensis (strain GHG001) TaxID=1365824 RepID=V5GKS0_KALBG|nr:RNA recognition motif domain protein [Kalmanozyma brasiliensis GHG001]EST06532.1 RNA recognition motif domain protein [Kalmanozyma brasiliensis GHG001]
MHPAPPTASGSEDPRVYVDRLSGNWRYEDDEGDEWEWQPFLQHARPAVDLGETEDEVASTSASASSSRAIPNALPAGHWVKVLDDDLIRAQQAAYSIEGVDEAQPAQAVLRRGKKRPASPDITTTISAGPSASTSSVKLDRLPPSKKPKPITSLYVTGLPLDATVDEIARVFSRYGVLLEDDSGNPRIKMYHDDKTGMFKGEALVVYFKPESVELAISMLDETSMRAAIGSAAASGPVLRVQRAEFPTSSNGVNHTQPGPEKEKASKSSAETPSHGQRRNLSDQDRKKIAKRVARLETKLSDWRDESLSPTDETAPSTSAAVSAGEGSRTVVLTKMFTLYELDSDPTLLLDLKQDVREECTDTIGGVTNVVLWDKEPEGIMTVKFQKREQAEACVSMMKGRFFAQRRIDAWISEGKPRFRRSGGGGDSDDEDGEGEEKKRKDAFASWLDDEA